MSDDRQPVNSGTGRTGISPIRASVLLIAGILAGTQFHPSLFLSLAGFAAGILGGIFFYLRGKGYVLDQLPKRISRVFFCLAILFAGMVRTSIISDVRPAGSVENFTGDYVNGLSGYVIAPPVTTTSRTSLRVQLERTQNSEILPNNGKVLLVFYSDPGTDFQYGDRLSISGQILLPPDSGSGFSYREYLARSGITALINNPHVQRTEGFRGSRLKAGIYQLRSVLVDRIFRLFPKPENALMAGILLGDESKITSDIDRAFQKTGTAHIIAISGANFTLLTWLVLSLVRRLIPRWWAPPLVMIPFIWFYTILVGGNSAVVRAGIMCALSIIGSSRGRTGNGLNNLALTAALMSIWDPSVLSDVGFQLSVTATLGILLYSEPLCNLVRGAIAKLLPKISEEALTSAVNVLNGLCLMSISAGIYTMWVSAQAFGRISLISLPANFLIAPFQSLIMLGGFAALLLSFIFYPLGAAAAWLIWPAPALTIRIVQFCSKIRWGSVYVELPSWQAWLIIGLITALLAGRNQIINSFRKRFFQPYAALLLLFSAVMIWTNVFHRMKNQTEIIFSQTSSSMKLTIRSPENRIFVIGDNLTNYAAQDLLEKQIFPIARIPEAAWLDIPEEWMRKAFLSSEASGDLSLLYLNGISRVESSDVPEKIREGMVFSMDGIRLHYTASYMLKRAWIIEDRGWKLLFPNGVPPERIFTRSGPDLNEITLVVLGARDNPGLWDAFAAGHGNRPQRIRFSDSYDVSLYLTNTGISGYPAPSD